MDQRSLVVCAIFKDAAQALPEWIAYHCAIGFDRFVLYDNASTDGGADLLRRFPLADRVTVIQWPQPQGQLSAYRHFIDIFAPAYDWAAFIDVDEFILPLDGSRLQDTLQRCGHASAILLNGRVFGPAGHEEPADGLVIEAYDMRVDDALPVNRHVKSIVRCADLLDVTQDPRIFRLKGPVCNALGQEVPNVGVQQAACFQGLAINHYYTKSRREWLAKVNRDRAMAGGPNHAADLFDQLAAACQVKDETIKAYAPRVRDLLGMGATAAPAVAAPASAMPAATVPPELASVPWAAGAPAGSQPAAGWFVATPSAAPPPVQGQRWTARGPDALEHAAGLALVFRDRSRPAAPWLAALRGDAATLIDPDFLLDEAGRLRDFPDEQEARAACDAALDDYQSG